ncbi:MAG: pyridoxal-dependent decarboxylase, exosortase A system-associated [Methylococcaceae bacterium]
MINRFTDNRVLTEMLSEKITLNFPTKNAELTSGGIAISQLAQRIGQTPFYAYDRNLITRKIVELRKQMPPDLKIHYAVKANPMPAVVQHISTLVDGLDLASVGEMKIALDTTMPVKNISFAAPAKRDQDLTQAIAAEITINVESQNELEKIAQLSEKIGIQANVAIRINPSFELKSSGVKMGGGAKPFGIDEELVPDVLKRVKTLELDFKGFHIFSGSQCLKADVIIDAQQKSLDLAIRLADFCPTPIQKLNIGGGFGIPYFPNESELNIQQIGDSLFNSMNKLKKIQPQIDVIIELGRYLVGEAGIYVSQILDKKFSRGQTFLVVNGGLHQHLAASGNFGQILRKNYPIAIGNKMNSAEKEMVNIVGLLCTPLDILADKVELPKAEIGDFVVIFQSGAYGFTASPREFLSQPDITEVLV